MSLAQNIKFSQQLQAFHKKADFRTREVFVGSVSEAYRSIVLGSEVTGAPGQPVDTGTLRASWQVIWESVKTALIGTKLDYALPIENGTTHGVNMKLRSQVGGFHSVKTTIAAMGRIVETVRKEVTRGDA